VPVALVSGANRGIGRETARQLAERGYDVVVSGMGGVAEMGGWWPGYRISKAALNAMTRILSTELEEAGAKVNSACPGFVKTGMGAQFGAQKPVEDAAAGIVWLATLDDGPTGGFFRDGTPVAF